MHSWRILILPFMEEQELFDQYDFTKPWNSEANLRLADKMPEFFAFHGEYEPGMTTTNYLAVVGPQTLWPEDNVRSIDEVTDASSTTVMLVENHGQEVHWMEPRDLEYETMEFVVNSPEGVSSKYLSPAVVMADGSLRKLQEGLAEDIFKAMMTVDGGEKISREGDRWSLLSDGRLRQTRVSDSDSP